MSDQQTVTFIPRLHFKPGAKEDILPGIYEIIDRMSQEPAFVHTALHEDLDNPDVLVLYETWKGTKESFMREQLTKDYRREYENNVSTRMFSRDFLWLSPPLRDIRA